MNLCNTYSFWASKRGNPEVSLFLLLEHSLFWSSFTFCNVLHKAEEPPFCDPPCARCAGLTCISTVHIRGHGLLPLLCEVCTDLLVPSLFHWWEPPLSLRSSGLLQQQHTELSASSRMVLQLWEERRGAKVGQCKWKRRAWSSGLTKLNEYQQLKTFQYVRELTTIAWSVFVKAHLPRMSSSVINVALCCMNYPAASRVWMLPGCLSREFRSVCWTLPLKTSL